MLGLITHSGRILTAKLLLGHPVEGLTHCAIGSGDDQFTDPKNPPPPAIDQTGLLNEAARKLFYKRSFLKEDPEGVLKVNGIRYVETPGETRTIGIFFRFEEEEANGLTIKEYGFFGGHVAYVQGHTEAYAAHGLFHPETNPQGQVRDPGILYEVNHIPDFNKTSDTRIELVGVITL